MARKVVEGPIRKKERTKQKLLNAVGIILKTKGYLGLRVTKIALEAGCDKKLIYEYFGSTDKLIDEYLKSKYHSAFFEQKVIDKDVYDDKEILKIGFINNYEDLKNNNELQKLLLWKLAEKRPILKSIFDKKEELQQDFYKRFSDKTFQNSKAILVLLEAGLSHLALCAARTNTTFSGIDLKSDVGGEQIQTAIADIIEFVYQNNDDINT